MLWCTIFRHCLGRHFPCVCVCGCVCLFACLRLSQQFHIVLSSWRQEGKSYWANQPGNPHALPSESFRPMRPHRSLFLLTALFSYILILAAFLCLFLFVSFHLIFSYSFITSASLLIPTSTSSLQKSVVSYFPTLYALVILGAPSSRFSCHSPPTSSSFTPSLLICLHPLLLSLSLSKHPFLFPSSRFESKHCLSLSAVKDSPLSSNHRFGESLQACHSVCTVATWPDNGSFQPQFPPKWMGAHPGARGMPFNWPKLDSNH